jgi:hypothetical protein
MTGAYYVHEKRIWPFYRKTEVYPIASTMPRVYKPQAVSLAELTGYDVWEPPRNAGNLEDEADSRGINIAIGDNNENVTINIDGRKQNSDEPMELVTVPNHSGKLPGRVVDVEVPQRQLRQLTRETAPAEPREADTPAEPINSPASEQ